MKIAIIEKINSYIKQHSLQKLAQESGIEQRKIIFLLRRHRDTAIPEDILKTLYTFFHLPTDWFYLIHIFSHPRIKRHEGIVGQFLRVRRLQAQLSVSDAARLIRMDTKTIERIERGVQLPSTDSYAIKKLAEIYNLSGEEFEGVMSVIRGVQLITRQLNRIKKQTT